MAETCKHPAQILPQSSLQGNGSRLPFCNLSYLDRVELENEAVAELHFEAHLEESSDEDVCKP